MKILVTGATGLVGKSLVKGLISKGHQVVITTRDLARAQTLFPTNVTCVLWENFYQRPPKEALDGINGVIHLMGENIGNKRWSKAQKRLLEDSRIESAKNIIATLKSENRKLDFFITSSAIGIYPSNLGSKLTEESSLSSLFLGSLCQRWENASRDQDVVGRHVAVRTGVVLGTNEGAMAKMLPIFKLGLGGPIGDGNQIMSWIHVDDLVNVFIYAIENNEISGAVNAVAPLPVDNFTFSKALGKALHRPSFMLTPALPLKIALGEMSSIILDSQYVEPKRLLENKFSFKFADINSAFHNLYGS